MIKDEFYVQWHITEICNLDCFHCYKEPFRKELDLDRLIFIAEKLQCFAKEKNVKLVISLTGGEPFLKKEIYEISEYLDKISDVDEINFISNGTVLPSKKIKKLKKLNMIYISLESYTREINDIIRGKGVFDEVMKNLTLLNSAGFNLGIMTTLMNTNINHLCSELEKFIQFFLQFRNIKEVIFERFIPVGRARELKSEVVRKEDLFKFYTKIGDYCNIHFDEIKKYKALKIMFDNKFSIFGAECTSGENGCAVLSDGTVYPCRRLDLPLGNLLKDNLHTILIGQKIKELLDNIDYLHCFAMNKSLNNISEGAQLWKK